jgi:hypothetical protein
MDQGASKEQVYYCPMHSDVRQPNLGKCPRCGMDLVPEGMRFALLRHMISNPLHLIVMIALMAGDNGGSNDDDALIAHYSPGARPHCAANFTGSRRR